MATPAFIYAFDTLGPDRFAELCGLLLSDRYRGLLLGGVGPDEGVDASIDPALDAGPANQLSPGVASWTPETPDAVLDQLVEPGKPVVFQFKHKVIGRVGEATARQQLLSLYKGEKSEILKPQVKDLRASTYVLVTNVEITVDFRKQLKDLCKGKVPGLERVQVVGLDELAAWVTLDRQLRVLYFPTLFSLPRFNLKVEVMAGALYLFYSGKRATTETPMFQVKMSNIGDATSYIDSVRLCGTSKDGNSEFHLVNIDEKNVYTIEPGRMRRIDIPFADLATQPILKKDGFVPTHVRFLDEVGNAYEASIPEEIRPRILAGK